MPTTARNRSCAPTTGPPARIAPAALVQPRTTPSACCRTRSPRKNGRAHKPPHQLQGLVAPACFLKATTMTKQTMLSIDDLNAEVACERPFEFEFIGAKGEGTGIFFQVLGGESETVKAATNNLMN